MLGSAEVFTFFFVTLGPLKLLGPFALQTRGLDEARVRQIAFRVFALGTVSAIAGAILGRVLLAQWHVSLPAMLLAGGVVFFVVALKQLLAQYEPAPPPEPLPDAPLAAAARLVSPTVVAPYGIAAAIVLLAASTDTQRSATIVAMLFAVMVLNLLAMLYARRLLVGPGMIVLQVLGAILAVLQVALSIQLMLTGLGALGVPGLPRRVAS